MLTLLLGDEDLLSALVPVFPVVAREGGPEDGGEGGTRQLANEVHHHQ
jgi:hypothetical protein